MIVQNYIFIINVLFKKLVLLPVVVNHVISYIVKKALVKYFFL